MEETDKEVGVALPLPGEVGIGIIFHNVVQDSKGELTRDVLGTEEVDFVGTELSGLLEFV